VMRNVTVTVPDDVSDQQVLDAVIAAGLDPDPRPLLFLMTDTTDDGRAIGYRSIEAAADHYAYGDLETFVASITGKLRMEHHAIEIVNRELLERHVRSWLEKVLTSNPEVTFVRWTTNERERQAVVTAREATILVTIGDGFGRRPQIANYGLTADGTQRVEVRFGDVDGGAYYYTPTVHVTDI
jgi:hypothetical protein